MAVGHLKLLNVIHTIPDKVILTTSALMNELHEVIFRAKFRQRLAIINRTPLDWVNTYQSMAEWVMPFALPMDTVRDPKDLKFLECAVGGSANYIITGDNDLLVLHPYQNISIVTAIEFFDDAMSQ